MSSINVGIRSAITALALGAVACCVTGQTMACDTPVYRYAMYRWQPTPYEVYYFHTEPAGKDDQQVFDAIKEVNDANSKKVANIVSLRVDLHDDKELLGVPPDVKKAWLARTDKSTPAYMVVSPLGLQVDSGKLDKAEVGALVDSPGRQKLAKELGKGNATVFVFLTCGDEKADAEAEKQLKEIVASVSSGKLNLYSGPADANGPDAKDEKAKDANKESKSPKIEVGYVRINREDKAERWFVRQLMAVEGDLYEFVDKPMIFAAYGRGRVLPPFIGKGINQDNLAECVQFVTGACSCTVKEQNPGVDLLVRYDWESASAAIAEKFGSEEGNENQFGIEEFFPILAMDKQPTAPEDRGLGESLLTLAVNTAKTKLVETIKRSRGAKPDAIAKADISMPTAGAKGNNAHETTPPENSTTADPDKSAVALANANNSNPEIANRLEQSSGVTMTMMITIGAGIGIALFVLIGATFVLFKPR